MFRGQTSFLRHVWRDWDCHYPVLCHVPHHVLQHAQLYLTQAAEYAHSDGIHWHSLYLAALAPRCPARVPTMLQNTSSDEDSHLLACAWQNGLQIQVHALTLHRSRSATRTQHTP